MKKNIAFICCSLIAINAFSQITITQSTTAPSVGDSYDFNTIQNGSFDYSPSGMNQTWDFSNAIELTTSTFNYVNLDNSSNGNSYPAANVVETASGAENYYAVSSTGSTIVGQYQGGLVDITYTDEREFIRYPLTYGDVYNSTFVGKVKNILAGIELTRSGTVSISADGYGTLKLPGGVIITDALRISNIATYSDNYMGVEVSSGVDSIITWYSGGIKNYIANFSVAYSNGTKALAQGIYREGLTSNSVPNRIHTPTITLYPNPAQNLLTISCVQNGIAAAVYDILGKKEAQMTLKKGNNVLDISRLNTGAYVIKYQLDNQIKTVKFLVQ